MRAAVLTAYGSPLEISSVPRPEAGEGQVLIRVKASAVNPLDLKISKGQAAHARHPLPAILGIDVAGTVGSVGRGVTAFKPGDEVYGMAGGVGSVPGSLAEFIAADATLLAPKSFLLTPMKGKEAWVEPIVDKSAKTISYRIRHGGTNIIDHLEGVEPSDVTGQFYSSDPGTARKRQMMRSWVAWCEEWTAKVIKEDTALRDRDLMAAEIRKRRYKPAAPPRHQLDTSGTM
jgi:NADPH:quinone reductase